MTYTVYGIGRSGSAIVEMALAKLSLPYEVRPIDIGVGAQQAAEYTAINPQAKIPAVITPQGETLTETLAIVITLDERHRAGGLLPAPGSADRVQALRWMTYVATEIYPLVEINDYPERFAIDADSAPATREVARAIWRRRWLVVERAIEGDPWLLPSGFTMADAYLAVVSRWAQQAEWRSEHTPRIEAITSAIAHQPDIGPVWTRHFG